MSERNVWTQLTNHRLSLALRSSQPIEIARSDIVSIEEQCDLFFNEHVLRIIQNSPSYFVGQLQGFQSLIEKQDGIKPSKPRVLTAYINYGIGGGPESYFAKKTLEQRQRGNDLGFAILFDFTAGISFFCQCLTNTESEIRGDLDALITQELANFTTDLQQIGVSTNAGDEADTYLKYRDMIGKFGRLLRQDSTGFSLADAIVDESLHRPEEKFNREILHAGTRLAARTYKTLYHL